MLPWHHLVINNVWMASLCIIRKIFVSAYMRYLLTTLIYFVEISLKIGQYLMKLRQTIGVPFLDHLVYPLALIETWRPTCQRSPHSSCPRSTTATVLLQVHRSMNWTGCSLSSTRLLGSRQMPADTTMWCSYGLTLAAGARTYPVQAVCAGVRLPERNSTGILVRPDSVCRQYRTSPATISVDLKSGGTINPSRINLRPCVCRCWSTSVEQFTTSPPLNLQIVLFLQKT